MESTRRFLRERGLPDRELGELPASTKRFPDGAQYRVEIPSVEGPGSFRAVLEACTEFGVQVHRISQGSGIMVLTDEKIAEMAAIGARERIESRERVRRAKLGLQILHTFYPTAQVSALGASGLAVPLVS
jgi:hypothetical protein